MVDPSGALHKDSLYVRKTIYVGQGYDIHVKDNISYLYICRIHPMDTLVFPANFNGIKMSTKIIKSSLE